MEPSLATRVLRDGLPGSAERFRREAGVQLHGLDLDDQRALAVEPPLFVIRPGQALHRSQITERAAHHGAAQQGSLVLLGRDQSMLVSFEEQYPPRTRG